TEIFVHQALDLLEEVARGAVSEAGIELKDIGAIVVNTITGLSIPSLDAKLMNRLDLPASVERLPVFGLGCGGGVAGLARSARYAQAMPGAHVLFLTVDLCSLCLRVNDPSLAMFVSAALFGVGAAALASQLPLRRGGSATVPRACAVATLRARGKHPAGAGGSSPRTIISGATPST